MDGPQAGWRGYKPLQYPLNNSALECRPVPQASGGPEKFSGFGISSRPANVAVMSDDVNIFDFPAAAALEQGENWMRLMPAGKFRLRDGRGGDLDAGDQLAMQAIVDRTKAYFGTVDIMVDYDHELVRAQAQGGRAEAAGWIKDLQVRADGLYGRVEWTAAAAEKIRAGAYRYISPWFRARDGRVERLINVALVNMPALDLQAIAASVTFNEETSMDKIARALGLADTAGQDAILAAINERHTQIAAAAGLRSDARYDDIVASVTASVAGVRKIAAAVGLEAGAKIEDIAAAAAGTSADFVPAAQFTQIKTRLDELTASVGRRDVDEAVAAAMEAGKVAPAQETWARGYAEKDLDGFRSYVASAQVLVAPQGKGAAADERTGAGDLTAIEIAARAQAYIAEQERAGIEVDIIAAVDHVTAQASK